MTARWSCSLTVRHDWFLSVAQ